MSETRRVRIAVAIDAEGNWEALGSRSEGDADIASMVEGNHGDEHSRMEDAAPPAIVWVEAEVPLPSAVEGRVEG